jgi:putative addiction module component (TIGR02574 family)
VAAPAAPQAAPVAGGWFQRYFCNMAQPLPIPPPGFDELTPEQKLDYVAALWDRIAAEQSQLPISEAQRALLRDRLAAHRDNPGAARPWSEARRDIEQLLRQRPSR